MKVTDKKPAAITSIPGMINPVFRKEFLEDMPNKGGAKVRGVDLTLINDALRAISEGNAQINGKAPATRSERFIVISAYFNTARTRFNIPFDGVSSVKENCTVSIKYQDQLVSQKFPLVASEN